MNIVITGGFGFIGKNLLLHLLNDNNSYNITVISRSKKPNDAAFSKVKHVLGSYSDIKLLRPNLKDVDLVIHLAYSSVPENSSLNPIEDINTNVIGTIMLLNTMVEENVKNIIFMSSGGTVYGVTQKTPIDENNIENPISAYGISKLSIEKYISFFHKLYGINYCILRVSNAYGLGQHSDKKQGVIPIWTEMILKGNAINIIGDGSSIRDYIHVDDLCRAIKLCLEKSLKNNIYNVGTCVGISLSELVLLIEKKTGYKSKKNHIPHRQYDVPYNVLKYDKISKDLGWKPKILIEEGISSIIYFINSGKNLK
ncbi:MAG: NAD-dependent epimerase/dehydratase family protein [Flavobacteriales bacterium]